MSTPWIPEPSETPDERPKWRPIILSSPEPWPSPEQVRALGELPPRKLFLIALPKILRRLAPWAVMGSAVVAAVVKALA